jgi:hypothetical protein
MSILDSILGGLLSGGSDDLGCDWHCDNCETLMSSQPGLSVASGVWTCTECGFVNNVTTDNIRHYGELPVTDAQLGYNKRIEGLLGVSFSGITLEEASDFINTHRDHYQAKLHTP